MQHVRQQLYTTNLVQDVMQMIHPIHLQAVQPLVIVIQVHIKQVLMQPIAQENVQDVLHMEYLQQHTVGLQQQLQHVLLMEQQNVLIVAKPKRLQSLDIIQVEV